MPQLSQIPKGLNHNISSFLDARDLCSYSTSCRQIHRHLDPAEIDRALPNAISSMIRVDTKNDSERPLTATILSQSIIPLPDLIHSMRFSFQLINLVMEEHQSCSFDLKESDTTVIASLRMSVDEDGKYIINVPNTKDGIYIMNVPNPKVGEKYTLQFTTNTGVRTNVFWVLEMRAEIVIHGRKLASVYNKLASIPIDEDDMNWNWGEFSEHLDKMDLPLQVIQPAFQYRYQAHGSSEYESLLHVACRLSAPIAIIELLLEKGGHNLMNIADSEGYLPLHAACIWDNIMAARILVEKGGDALLSPACSDDLASDSPLHCVCVSGNEEIAKVLLSAGGRALTEVIDKDGNTPMQTACKYGRVSIVQLILQVRQERIVRVTKANGQTYLDVAKISERLDSSDELKLINEYVNERRLMGKIIE